MHHFYVYNECGEPILAKAEFREGGTTVQREVTVPPGNQRMVCYTAEATVVSSARSESGQHTWSPRPHHLVNREYTLAMSCNCVGSDCPSPYPIADSRQASDRAFVGKAALQADCVGARCIVVDEGDPIRGYLDNNGSCGREFAISRSDICCILWGGYKACSTQSQTIEGRSATLLVSPRLENAGLFSDSVTSYGAREFQFEGRSLNDVQPAMQTRGSVMNDVSFLIGKEIGELKARLEHLEGGSAGCGCKGKKQSAQNFGSGRTPLCGKLEKLHPMIVETVNKAIAEALADAGVDAKLYLRNYVLSSAEIRPTEICCYYCSNGDYCCGDCNDPFCRNC